MLAMPETLQLTMPLQQRLRECIAWLAQTTDGMVRSNTTLLGFPLTIEGLGRLKGNMWVMGSEVSMILGMSDRLPHVKVYEYVSENEGGFRICDLVRKAMDGRSVHIVPCHHPGREHWTLLEIDELSKELRHYDPLKKLYRGEAFWSPSRKWVKVGCVTRLLASMRPSGWLN